MKKVIFALALVASMCAVSCNTNKETEVNTTDSVVVVDSQVADTVQAIDTVCAE